MFVTGPESKVENHWIRRQLTEDFEVNAMRLFACHIGRLAHIVASVLALSMIQLQ